MLISAFHIEKCGELSSEEQSKCLNTEQPISTPKDCHVACLNNVFTAFQAFGGEGRLGYLLWEIWGGLCLSAEPHCIWHHEGNYREITPQYQDSKVCFGWTGERLRSLEDFEKAFDVLTQRSTKTVVEAMVQHPLVEEAIAAWSDITQRAWVIGNTRGLAASHNYQDARIGEVRTLVEQYHSQKRRVVNAVRKKADRQRRKAERQRRKRSRS